jgi:hypothetical protein
LFRHHKQNENDGTLGSGAKTPPLQFETRHAIEVDVENENAGRCRRIAVQEILSATKRRGKKAARLKQTLDRPCLTRRCCRSS